MKKLLFLSLVYAGSIMSAANEAQAEHIHRHRFSFFEIGHGSCHSVLRFSQQHHRYPDVPVEQFLLAHEECAIDYPSEAESALYDEITETIRDNQDGSFDSDAYVVLRRLLNLKSFKFTQAFLQSAFRATSYHLSRLVSPVGLKLIAENVESHSPCYVGAGDISSVNKELNKGLGDKPTDCKFLASYASSKAEGYTEYKQQFDRVHEVCSLKNLLLQQLNTNATPYEEREQLKKLMNERRRDRK